MSIKIKRNTGWMGMFSNIVIITKGEKGKEIQRNETLNLELPEKKVTLQVSQLGAKSNELVVSDGDEIEITTTNWINYGFLFVILSNIINPILGIYDINYELRYFLTSITLILAVAIFFSIFFKGTFFRIKQI